MIFGVKIKFETNGLRKLFCYWKKVYKFMSIKPDTVFLCFDAASEENIMEVFDACCSPVEVFAIITQEMLKFFEAEAHHCLHWGAHLKKKQLSRVFILANEKKQGAVNFSHTFYDTPPTEILVVVWRKKGKKSNILKSQERAFTGLRSCKLE